jgi:UDP-N-acetyl-2-amino-2-deoxyglucuronate dehydrogenase
MTVRVGLIGAGNISDTHARALRAIPGVEIASVYAPTLAHAEALAQKYGGAAFDSLAHLLAHKPLDMVVIGSPSGRHADHGIAAAMSGVHVLVEKPIDVTTARADVLIAEAARSGVTLGVIFQDRLKPGVQRLKALVDAGRLGAPILANARVKWYRPPSYYRDSRWRGTRALDGGGALMNQGVHTVDLLLWLFGPVRRVFAKTIAGLHQIEVEDTAVAVLEFANGAIGTLEAATSAYPGYSRQIELTGSNGTLKLDGDDLAAIDLRDVRDEERLGSEHPPEAGRHAGRPPQEKAATVSAASPVVSDPIAHVRVFEDFLGAVARGVAPCCDGPCGRRSVALIEAIYQSALTNLPVDLPPA